MAEYIISPEQLERVIPEEDIEFVRKYREKYGDYPTYRGLQFGKGTVGEVHPTHPKKDLKWSTYIISLSKYLKPIIMMVSKEKGEELADIKKRGKRLLSLDKKHLFVSQLEAFTYNIFLLENVVDEMELEPKKFLSSCNKIPDFLWEKQKMVIEVAGMESEKYINKLEDAKKCFSKLGYNVVILDARKFEKSNKFAEYYLYLCEVHHLHYCKHKTADLDSPIANLYKYGPFFYNCKRIFSCLDTQKMNTHHNLQKF